ncbi:Methyltransferase FkbM [Senna tora]|uniref:Methyltransferase FkbM n=1 Tax=Senna tora TaxID=362788 RepID=A0A834XI94_9FABA|nr:Methyltransferase FkbM [Senna tora]
MSFFFPSSLHFASSHHFLPETLKFVIAGAGAGALAVESNDAVVSRTSDGYLSPGSKSLCVETPTGHDVFALKEIGVSDSIGISKKASKPLVKAGLAHRMPFRNNTFDFIIFTNHTLLGFSARCDCIVVLIGGFGKPVGNPSYYRLTDMEKHQAHRHVLMNCTHVDPFVQEFKEITRRRLRSRTRSAAIIQRTVHREFASWFYNREPR